MLSSVEIRDAFLEDARAMANLDEHPDNPDYMQLQRAALANGEPLPPSALRALLREAAASSSALDNEADRASSLACTKTDSSSSGGSGGGSSASSSSTGMISHLPDCMLYCILGFLDAPGLSSVACANRELAALAASSDDLWRVLVARRFDTVRWALPACAHQPLDGQSWRALYLSLSTPGPRCWRSLAAAPHASDGNCWIVIGDGIYDVSDFLHRHPGLPSSLLLFGGTDATEAFAEVPHSPLAHHVMRSLQVPGLILPPEPPPRLLGPDETQFAHALSAELPTLAATMVRRRLGELKTFVAETVTDVCTSYSETRTRVSEVAGSVSSSVSVPSLPLHVPNLPLHVGVPSLPSVSVPSLPSLPSLPSVSVPSLHLRRPSWDGSSLATTAAACVAGVAAVTERFGPMRPSAWAD
jgi:hypothetical protein